MHEIYFFTSNRVKLANFKHIARAFGLQVLGFRERTYRGPYEEPRIDNREALLSQSYESAVKKWVAAFGHLDARVFMLEDTSVRIDSLSAARETPGVDVKYWMRAMTFSKLDELLKARGNLRTATVRSDIIAHIPVRLRDALGDGKPFVWVRGETRGRIVDTEPLVPPNLVSPWLDAKSFSRWFVPDGQSRVLSALPIQDADQFDFRRKAFANLISSFKGLLSTEPSSASRATQLLLPGFASPPIWVICGYSCAGKTTLASWLSNQYGFIHLEASDFMRQAYWERHGIASVVDIADFAKSALAVEPWIAARPIANEIKRLGFPAVVVSGFRSPGEFQALQREMGYDRPIQGIFIEADDDVRYQRAQLRAREPVSHSSFVARDKKERSMGLDEIRKLHGQQALENNFVTLQQYTRAFGRQFSADLLVLGSAVHEGASVSMGKLEELILLGLLNSHGEALTTTQIAQAIQYYFAEAKSKNNVSRYFNQEFHPFYRADLVDGKIVYRLSATGESVARLLEVLRHSH